MLNARSILRKTSQLKSLAFIENPDIICVSESWSHSAVSDLELEIDNFSLYRHDRNDRRGGGTLLHVKSVLDHSSFTPNFTDFLGDACFATIRFNSSDHAIVGSVYLPPNKDPDCSSLICLLSSIIASNYAIKIIAGDFNKPTINWDNNTSAVCCESLLDFINSNGWSQIIRSPTRFSSILDLIFIDGIIPLSKDYDENSFCSDHKVIKCIFAVTKTVKHVDRKIYTNFNSADSFQMDTFIRNFD